MSLLKINFNYNTKFEDNLLKKSLVQTYCSKNSDISHSLPTCRYFW